MSSALLPLNAFEQFMVASDGPSYPMSFYFRLLFDRSFDKTLFFSAVESARSEHPILKSRLEHTTSGPHWIRETTDRLPIYWNDSDAQSAEFLTDFTYDGQIDLIKSAGLRVWLRGNQNQSEAVFEFHHACCDAIGAYQFLETLMETYVSLERGDIGRTFHVPSRWEQLFKRDQYRTSALEHVRRLPHDLRRIVQFFAAMPVPLEGVNTDTIWTGFPGLVSHVFSVDVSTAYVHAAERAAVSVNDLLLRDLFVAMHQWNLSHGRDGVLRVAVPINMRHNSGPVVESAVNVVSMVFIDRTADQSAEQNRLLKSLHDEMYGVKHWKTGFAMLWLLNLASRVPRGFAPLVDKNRCVSSVVLSNIGRLGSNHVCEALNLNSIEFFPPIRPLTKAAFGVLNYRGQLVLSLQYDTCVINASSGREILQAVVQQVIKSTE